MMTFLRSNPLLCTLIIATLALIAFRTIRLATSSKVRVEHVDANISTSMSSFKSGRRITPDHPKENTRHKPRHAWPDRVIKDPFVRTAAPVCTQPAAPAPVELADSQPKRLVPPELILTGILYGNSSVAVINGKSVRVGMSINGCLVQSIQSHRVDLIFSGTPITLTVGNTAKREGTNE